MREKHSPFEAFSWSLFAGAIFSTLWFLLHLLWGKEQDIASLMKRAASVGIAFAVLRYIFYSAALRRKRML